MTQRRQQQQQKQDTVLLQMITSIKYYRKPAGHFRNIFISPEACVAFLGPFLSITGTGRCL
jgi:hypothetical protein